MTPSTLVRARGPWSFITATAAALEAPRKVAKPFRRELPRCVACEDDGRRCNLPARYVDFKQGGHVCFEHRPDRKKEVLCLK